MDKPNYRRIVALGAGESGVGAAILAKSLGYEVFVSDKGNIQPAFLKELEQAGIPYEQEQHDRDYILGADLVIKSPGIPDKAPMMVDIHQAGILVVSEIEFASWFTDAFIVGITGTNGKTTTTRLTHHLLVGGGLDAAMGGNVGRSFARNVAERESPCHVLELSSFQLDDIKRFRPDISMLLNITPDHLDRYNYQMDNYIRSKFRIIENQREEDLFLYNGSDPVVADHFSRLKFPGRSIAISLELIDEGNLKAGEAWFDMNGTKLKGTHNYMNALFAIHAAQELGVSPDSIQASLNSYINAPHRMEWIAEIDGVTYYNDSKATNVESAYYALEAMRQPMIWIVGGQDKGNDYSPLLDLVRQKARAVICLGVDNHKILDAFGGLVPKIVESRSARDAVRTASELAQPGDVVLLSPACASFDLFRNYEDRGDQFRAAVLEIKAEKA